jgi:cysteine desulfurase
MKPIYLDYAATTPLDARVAAKMAACLTSDGIFGNPASLHVYGRAAREAVELAREQVAALLKADPSEIIWTSGATESINLALKGAARLYQRKGKHIVTLKTEHKAVLDTCQQLEKEGFQVTYLTPEPNGLIELSKLTAALRDDTVLVSIMYVNNETGVMQDIDAIAGITSARNILFHVDAVQAAGKFAINVERTPIDLLSVCAHKIYGPKGVGALYLRKKPRVRVEPLLHGGGHEQGMRSGTLATHQVVGMGEAFALAQATMHHDKQHVSQLQTRFLQGLQALPNLHLNTDLRYTSPYILNVRFENMLADAILADLPGIATSTASACQGKGTEGSYVLRAMGLTTEQVKSSIRFSLGRGTTESDIDSAIEQFIHLYAKSSAGRR